MGRKIYLVLFIIAYVISVPVFGSDMLTEIEHILTFVEKTECQFERNGKMYTGENAVEHIRKKYHYYKDKIDSTERFIELSATKSTISGKHYMILCKGNPKITSQEWLLLELEHYRSKIR